MISTTLKSIAYRALMLVLAIFTAMCGPGAMAQDGARPLTVGVLTSPAPFYSFSEATGEPTGFALDVWSDVARRAGRQFELAYFNTQKELEAAAAAKSIDVAALLVVNETTSKLFDFTTPVHQSPISIFVRDGTSDITGLRNLAGHRVAVVRGHIGQDLMRTYRGELSIAYDKPEDALSSLMTKATDAVVHESNVFWQIARQQGIESLLVAIDPSLTKLDLAIGVRKGQRDLLPVLQASLDAYMQSTAFYEARAAWGGNPPPLISARAVAKFLGALLAISIVGLGLWRHFSIVRLNRALARSIAEREAAEERFKDVAEAASDWFFEQNDQFQFTFISQRYEDLTGIPTGQLIGRTRWSSAQENGADISSDNWQAHIATMQAHDDWRDFSYKLTAADGTTRTIITSGKAIFDEQSRFTGYRGVGRDITRRIVLESALQQSQKMEVVGQLTGGIAHDFNNLLTVMVGNIELLKRRVAPGNAARVYLDTTSEAVDLGSQLVQQLLGFSRRQSLNPAEINLNGLVEQVLPLVKSSLGSTVEVVCDLADELPAAYVDEVQLQNAILNLAINARDAMPDGGKLTIATYLMTADKAFCEANPGTSSGDYLVASVRDSGSGIAREDLEKVVEPFFTTKDVGKGTGLGLSTVYGFAEQSGGFLVIDSEVGEGTHVDIHLPPAVSGDEAAPSTDWTDPATKSSPSSIVRDESNDKTVLVVEDDDRVRDVTVARLEALGYVVMSACDGQGALATLNSGAKIDLMVTDINMPGGMSGIELANEVARTRPHVKVLFSAAYSAKANSLEAQGKLGPWLRKPYKQHELAAKLDDVLAD